MRSVNRALPQVPLLVLNAAILPELISRITLLERATRKSMFERRGLVLYYYFLVFSTIVFPLFSKERDENHKGLDVLNLGDSKKFFGNPPCWTGQSLGEIVVQVEGFVIEYLCVTPRERREALEPFPFTWGWNYAWSLSVVFLALLFGPLIPATLPTAAVFFFLKYYIDKH